MKLAYSLRELQEAGGPAKTKAYELIAEGKLKSFKIGRATRLTGDSVRELLGAGAA